MGDFLRGGLLGWFMCSFVCFFWVGPGGLRCKLGWFDG